MANNKALVNGVGYSWVDISVNILGRTVEGITRIRYGHNQVKEDQPGRGSKAVERTKGQETFNCSMTLTKKEVAAINRSLKIGSKITDIRPFDIVISIVNDDNLPVKTILSMAEFTGRSADHESRTSGLVEELELIIADIIEK